MIQIRDGVFETNSSSSHSVTVVPEEVLDFGLDKETLRSGVIELRAHAFGDTWHRYYTLQEKLLYLLSKLAGSFLDNARPNRDCAAELRRSYPKADRLLAVVERVTGCRVSVVRPPRQSVWNSDTDGTGLELLDDEQELIAFLFSSMSFVEAGNDMRSVDMIKTDLGRTEERVPGLYPALPLPGGEKFELEFDLGNGARMAFRSDDLDLEIRPEGPQMHDLFAALDRTVITGADIASDRDPQEDGTATRTPAEILRLLMESVTDLVEVRFGLVSGAVSDVPAFPADTGVDDCIIRLQCEAKPAAVDAVRNIFLGATLQMTGTGL